MGANRWPRLELPLGPRLGAGEVTVGQDVVVHRPRGEGRRGPVSVCKVTRVTARAFELEGVAGAFTYRSLTIHLHPLDAAAAAVWDKQQAVLETLKWVKHFDERAGYWSGTSIPDIPDRILVELARLANLLRVDAREAL